MVVITFDTETTGLLADPSARIIEVGAVRHNLKTGQILGTFSMMAKPPSELIDDTRLEICKRISNIDKDEIMSADPYYEVMTHFVNWVDGDVLYAWNQPFDQRMVQRSLFDMAKENPYWAEQSHLFLEKLKFSGCWQRLYTMMNHEKAGTWEDGRARMISLRKAMMYEGITENQTHRALDDSLMASTIAHVIWNKLQ